MAGLLFGLLVIGAFGLFLALPRGRTRLPRLGLLALAAAGGLLIACLARLSAAAVADGAESRAAVGWLIACALVALAAAVRVITHPRPVYSALYFVLLVVAVTGLLLALQAEFLAAGLIIVYAGAILVTYVFVIMLAQQPQPPAYDAQAHEPLLGTVAGFVLLGTLALRLTGAPLPSPPRTELAGTVERVGGLLLSEYLVAVQLVGLLLLAALVGAVAIARRRSMEPGEEHI